MKLNLCTIDELKEISNPIELKALDFYINKYPLKLNTNKAPALKICFEISDTEIDVTTICKFIINSNIAFICLDFNMMAPKSDKFLYVGTEIEHKCIRKITYFLSIIKDNLIAKTMYFTHLQKEEIGLDEFDKYQTYLGQFNNGLIIQ